MKKYILFSLFIVSCMSCVNAQEEYKNGVFADFGFGSSGEGHAIQSFTLGYQRRVAKSLFFCIEYNDIQGSQSFESFFGEPPIPNQFGELGESYRLDADEDVFGRLLHVQVFTYSIRKYIQMSENMFIEGAIGANLNLISELDVAGVIFETNGTVNYENSYPQFGARSKFGAKVSLGGKYFINDYISINLNVSYFSLRSIVSANFGTTVSF